ncbi:MAG TPA: ATP-dependent DNA ligase [Aeromicrobium sp.]|nr:ATP-dependent DNA ligase [Aeromicrobium sp.]
MAARSSGQTISIGGHQFRLTHPDKVIYPETGTTKADVIDYYVQIAPFMLPHVVGRPATRKRWVDGVGTPGDPGQVFFEKNLPDSAPSWIRRTTIQHKSSRNSYIVIEGVAELAWLGQMAALEIHVPQWQAGPRNTRRNPDRLVLDLDPGPGAGLPECVVIAKRARKLLRELGLEAYPVTSGSKGIHLYAGLDRTHDAEYVNNFAKQFALALESELPDLVVTNQKKTLRGGKVLVDWSQNNQAKTTIAPYSLRGRTRPTVAVPRTWRELDSPDLAHLTFDQVLARMKRRKDPLAPLGRPVETAEQGGDHLEVYRSKRDPEKTPEPVPAKVSGGGGNSFVIQEHHARRLHWDFRLERDGVLVSWALPNGVPTDPKKNHLAVQTEDHPLEYGSFEGVIPKGQYGAGEVTIWDWGTYEAEKWRGIPGHSEEDGKGEVIATLQGQPDGGLGGEPVKVALIKTSQNWLAHRMELKPASPPSRRSGHVVRGKRGDTPDKTTKSGGRGGKAPKPMLASTGTVEEGYDWAFEMKWDGYRAIAVCDGDEVRLVSRNGLDMTGTYPRVATALAELDLSDAVLDGELVAFGANGAPSFNALQNSKGPVSYLVFDVLRLDGTDVTEAPYSARRDALEGLDLNNGVVRVPPAFDGGMADAMESSRELGLEGVVAKRTDSTYRVGKRSAAWVKLKHVNAMEVVIVGWRPGTGNRASTLGSLLMASPDGDELTYVGRVGSGFSGKALDHLVELLTPLERKTPPLEVGRPEARDAHWVKPTIVGEVTFTEQTPDGRLRHPVWKGLRPDKSVDDLRG